MKARFNTELVWLRSFITCPALKNYGELETRYFVCLMLDEQLNFNLQIDTQILIAVQNKYHAFLACYLPKPNVATHYIPGFKQEVIGLILLNVAIFRKT